MDALKKTLRVVLVQIPSENSQLHLSVRLFSKRHDHVRLANNLTLITSDKQYNPNKTLLAAYNSNNNHNDKAPIDPKKKPIVLLYGWLMSQDKFLRKFSDIYNNHGFDVLRVKVKIGEVLWPQSVTATVSNIKDFMLGNLDRPYLVHGFSVGGFVHTELIQYLLKCPQEESKQALSQIKAQTFDSVVDLFGVAEGIATSVYLNQPIRRRLASTAIQAYINLTRKQVFDIYIRDSEIFHANPLRVPSLMFYSRKDTIGAPGPIEDAIKQWRSKGIAVAQRCWETSEHVGHYKENPEEYTTYLNNFLASLGFIHGGVQGVKEGVVEVRDGGLNAGLRDSDAHSPNRFKTDIKKGGGEGDDGKVIEVIVEVGEAEVEKERKVASANKLL